MNTLKSLCVVLLVGMLVGNCKSTTGSTDSIENTYQVIDSKGDITAVIQTYSSGRHHVITHDKAEFSKGTFFWGNIDGDYTQFLEHESGKEMAFAVIAYNVRIDSVNTILEK